MTDLETAKREMRTLCAKRRVDIAEALNDAGVWLAVAVMARAADIGLADGPKTVALYHAMNSEMDVGPLLRALERAGHKVALPVVTTNDAPLTFRVWTSGDPLQPGGFGTSVPLDTAAEAVPDILFVPMLAYDVAGGRLGYGGGFYDRTIEALEKPAIGVAYAAQRVDSVPTGPHDRRMDWIATEQGLLDVAADERKR